MSDLTERLVALREDARVCVPLMKDYDTLAEAANRLTELEDLAQELYEEGKKMYDREFHGLYPEAFRRYEQEVGE